MGDGSSGDGGRWSGYSRLSGQGDTGSWSEGGDSGGPQGSDKAEEAAVQAVQQRPVAAALCSLACWVFFGWAGAAEEKTQGQAELSFRKK